MIRLAIRTHAVLPMLFAASGSFLEQFFLATASMSPEERGKYLELPPEGAPSIEEAHQVGELEGCK